MHQYVWGIGPADFRSAPAPVPLQLHRAPNGYSRIAPTELRAVCHERE